MKIEHQKIKIREVVKGYVNSDEEGVVGYSGRLNIRPKYQREFVYKAHQRDAVIETIKKGFPLNVMYWVLNPDGNFEVVDEKMVISRTKDDKQAGYEVLDGQQRTISFCEYVAGNFSIDNMFFHNLTDVEQNQILDYELTVYVCEGNDKEKLDWFRTINIAGEKLTEQELRNAVYTGPWLSDAKKYFSKTGCPAYNLASAYMDGSPIRQDYLETVLDWISGGKIEEYMSKNQQKSNASELWLYFNNVINWVKVVFKVYRKEMKGLDWGRLYNQHKNDALDAVELESEVSRLMQDEDVTKKSGIYEYLLTKKEKFLSLRGFTDKQKREAYERQQGICPVTKKQYPIEEMEADHITPWHLGGKTSVENLQMLSKEANRVKGGK
jgi:hypothetical protein